MREMVNVLMHTGITRCYACDTHRRGSRSVQPSSNASAARRRIVRSVGFAGSVRT